MASEERDTYKLSRGNLEVLRSIPLMMLDDDYRKKLRKLSIEFMIRTKSYYTKDLIKGIKDEE